LTLRFEWYWVECFILTQGLQGSSQRFAEFDLYWVELFILTQGLRCSAQRFAGFGVVIGGAFFLTQGLRCSAQRFAGFDLYKVKLFYNPLATLRIPNSKLFTLKFIRRPSLHFDNFR
jgi:hypothetical protein